MDKIRELHAELGDYLSGVKLGAAGRVLYFDSGRRLFILAIHTTSPEKTQELSNLAWDNIPDDFKLKLKEENIGFAGQQI